MGDAFTNISKLHVKIFFYRCPARYHNARNPPEMCSIADGIKHVLQMNKERVRHTERRV